MKCYVVRHKETRELAAILYAHPESMPIIMDEEFSIGTCEYSEMPMGGLLFGDFAVSVPSLDESDNPRSPLDTASLSEAWETALHNGEDLNWEGEVES